MVASVRDFQQDILNGIDLNRLLNEAYAISIKVKDKEMEKWCHYEISGYDDIDNVPEYRRIPVMLVADGEFRHNIPVEIPADSEILNYHLVTDSISSLLKLTQHDDQQVVYFEFTNEANKKLRELYGPNTNLIFKQRTSISQLVGIESAVKEKIVNWGMHLEPELKKY